MSLPPLCFSPMRVSLPGRPSSTSFEDSRAWRSGVPFLSWRAENRRPWSLPAFGAPLKAPKPRYAGSRFLLVAHLLSRRLLVAFAMSLLAFLWLA